MILSARRCGAEQVWASWRTQRTDGRTQLPATQGKDEESAEQTAWELIFWHYFRRSRVQLFFWQLGNQRCLQRASGMRGWDWAHSAARNAEICNDLDAKKTKNPKRIYDFFACRSRQITWSIWSRRAWRGCCFFSICTSWPPKTHSMVGSWCVFPFFAHLFWSNKSERISQDKWKHARGHILVALHIPMMIQTTGSLAAKKLWRGIRKHFDLGWEYNPLPGFSTTIDWD